MQSLCKVHQKNRLSTLSNAALYISNKVSDRRPCRRIENLYYFSKLIIFCLLVFCLFFFLSVLVCGFRKVFVSLLNLARGLFISHQIPCCFIHFIFCTYDLDTHKKRPARFVTEQKRCEKKEKVISVFQLISLTFFDMVLCMVFEFFTVLPYIYPFYL